MTLLILQYFYIADIAKSDKFNPCIKPAIPISRISYRFLGGYSFYLAATS